MTRDAAPTPEPAHRPRSLFPARWSIVGVAIGVAIAGLQLALIRWLGLLLGLGVPLAILAVVLSGIALSALGKALVSRGQFDQESWERWFQRLTALVAGYLALLLLSGAGQILWELGYTVYLQRSMQFRYGFQAQQQLLLRDGELSYYPVIQAVDTGGHFEQAGIGRDDVVLFTGSKREFYMWLQQRGQGDFNLDIVPAGWGSDLSGSPVRPVTITTR